MKIGSNTKISKVIKENEEAIEVIASLNRHFTKLRNPILRRVLAPRVTIAEAAKIGKSDVRTMLNALASIGFEIDTSELTETVADASAMEKERIEFIEGKKCIVLDARPYLERDEDPFLPLQKELRGLDAEKEVLEVLIDFEPIPLIRIQEKKGFITHTYIDKDGLYHAYFKPGGVVKATRKSSKGFIKTITIPEYDSIVDEFSGEIVVLDVRDLEMPGPMITILEALSTLQPKSGIKVFHKKIPQHLLAELEERDLKIYINPRAEGNVMLFITNDV